MLLRFLVISLENPSLIVKKMKIGHLLTPVWSHAFTSLEIPHFLLIITTYSCTIKDTWDNLHEFFITIKCLRCFNSKNSFIIKEKVLPLFMSIVTFSSTLQILSMMLMLKFLEWNLLRTSLRSLWPPIKVLLNSSRVPSCSRPS